MVLELATELLSPAKAAHLLGVAVTTLYGWLGESDHGLFRVHGQPFTIAYAQTGARGQGRILIEVEEVERLRVAMRVQPQRIRPRRTSLGRETFPGITVKLGRPSG